MELWDQRVEPYAHALEGLNNGALCNLALDVIEATIPLLGLPLDEFFPPDRAELIKSALELRSRSPKDWQVNSDFAMEMLTRYDELPEVSVRPAVGAYLMALVRLFEGPPSSVSADDVMEILSSCYESVLMSHLTGRVTIDDELDSDRCVAAISRQIGIIEEFQRRR